MLEEIHTEEIVLISEDSVDCRDFHLRKKAMKIMEQAEEDDRSSARLAKIITIKIGARIMLRRNIDVTIGLVNGTIGVVTSIAQSLVKVKEYINSITIKLESGRQFPICLSYEMTIHKSQGLSLRNAVIDIRQTIFSYGETYVTYVALQE
ncbi:ATP-dependent DNA helicase PIF1-like [Diachasmimorpha longicaudata]|uniref:ATP-dependent DNA helicase PIF1-like n=1 Tax=Diachasmimorpha longicaudata TaxID=58733 RepID=UPI0030B8F808